MLSVDPGYINSAILEGIKDKIHEVERMLKALLKLLVSFKRYGFMMLPIQSEYQSSP